MINNQDCVILNTTEANNYHQPVSAKLSAVSISSIDSDDSDKREARAEANNYHQPVSAKPSVVSVSSIDSDVSDRRDVRVEIYAGMFRKHRKTILVLASFLKMLRVNRNKNNYASIKPNDDNDE